MSPLTYGVTISTVCTFCQRPAAKRYALARRSAEWERLVAPVCDTRRRALDPSPGQFPPGATLIFDVELVEILD